MRRNNPERLSRTPSFVFLALAVLTVCVGCNAALIGAGVVAVGIGAAALAYGCDEPVGVDVWDRKTAHSICDATVTAESEGHTVHFSPCYQGYLGEGTWTVTASKPGYRPSTGTVIITHDHRCGQPAYHSIELTLVPEGEMESVPLTPASEPASHAPAAPVSAPAPTPSAAPVEPPPPVSPSPSSSVPTQAFPPPSAPPTNQPTPR